MANLIDARWRVVFLCAAVAVVTTVPAQADCADGGAPLTPSVSIVHNGTTPNGLASFTISYSFPGTNHSWERGLRWLDEGQVIGHLSTDQGSGSVTPGQIIVACRTLGNHTFSAQAWTACNFQQSPTVTSSVNVYTDNTPATSLSASEPDASGVVTATLSYAFPNTFDERFRQIWLDIDGSVESTGGLQLQGTWVRSFSTTCKPNGIHYLYASVTACGGMPSSASASTSDSYTVNHKPTVTIGFDEKPEGTYAVSTFNFPQTTAPSQRLLELRRSHSNALIASTNPGAQSGTWRVLMTCDPGVPVYATAKACSDTPVKSGDAMPPKCELSCKVPTETPSSSCCIGDPVHANSGNMEFSDRDPLPGGMVAPLQRTYQSRNPAAGAFGTGWTTIMDARAIATGGTDGRDGVFLTLEDGRRVMFRRSGGVYAQTYPADSSTAGTLSFDAGRNGFLHRDAGSILSRIFRASDGRLVALVDVRGDEVVLTYDGNGKATSVADEAGRWSWSISYGTGGLIQSIAVDGQPGLTWTYGYTGTKLTTVTAPGSAVWRTYVYGSAGLVEIRDARGAVTERHEYDSAGRARSSFGPSGEFTDIQFNLAGRVTGESRTRVVSADGKSTDYYSRFIAGRMRTVEVAGSCNCASEDSVFSHDATGHVTREQNNKGWVTVRTFVNDRVASASTFHRPAGCDPETDTLRCRQTPDSLASVVLEPSAATITTTFTYGDANWPEQATLVATDSVVSGQQRQDAYTFDALTGVALSHISSGFDPVTTAAIQRTTQTTLYNGTEGAAFDPCTVNSSGCAFSSGWLTLSQPNGHVKSVNGPRMDVADLSDSVYYPLDNVVPAAWRGRLAAVRNGAGHVVRYEDYDVFGNARHVVAQNGSVTESSYDSLGRPLNLTAKALAGCDTVADPLCATDIVNRRMYDPLAGPLAIEVGPRGEAKNYTYDDRGRTVAVVRGEIAGTIPGSAATAVAAATWYEKLENQYSATTGRRTAESVFARESGSWVLKRNESYAYDDQGRLVTTTHADGTSSHYAFEAGELHSVRDENHASPNTFYGYDAAGRLVQVRQLLASAPGGEIATTYDYDRHGNLTSVTDPNGNVTTYLYDDFGQMIRQVSPVSGQTSYAYGAAGQLLLATDANGAATTRSYDVLGRALTASTVHAGDTEAISWTYDTGAFGIGRTTGMTDPSGVSTYQYDRRGLLIRETRQIEGATYVTSFGHDVAGNRTSMTYPSGTAVTYAFDYAGRQVTASAGATPIVTSASYLPFGPLRAVTYGNGTVRNMTYDQRYRLLSNKLSTAGTIIAQYAYGHDAVGNVTAIDDVMDAGYDRAFGYDDLNRLVTANGGASLWGTGTYVYDAMGNMQAATLGAHGRTFAYDGAKPRLTTVTENGFGKSVSYDSAGNETVVGAVQSTYSPRNQLQSLDEKDYTYDGRGVRTIGSRPSALLSLVVPDEIGGGSTAQGTVTLHTAAPFGGAAVSLTSSGSAAGVPTSMMVSEGEVSGTFTVTTSGVTTTTALTITATYDGVTLSEPLEVGPSQLVAVEIPSLKGGQSTTGTVSLNAPAPAGGAVVALSSSDATRLSVPATVTIPEGEDLATFTSSAPAVVASTISVTITAGYAGEEVDVAVSILPPSITSVTFASATLEGGELANAIVTLESAAAAGTVITFSSGSSDLQNPSFVTLNAGAIAVTVPVATSAVAATATAVLTAHLSPSSASGTVTLQPAAVTLQSFTVSPTSIVGTRTSVGTVVLTAAAPTGGLDVELSPFDADLPSGLVPPFVTVLAGFTQATFDITTPEVATTETRTIRARHSMTTIDRELQLQPPTTPIRLSFSVPGIEPPEGAGRYAGGDPFEIYAAGPITSVGISHPNLIEAFRDWFYIPGIDPMYLVETQAVEDPTDVMLTASSASATDMVARQRVILIPSSETPALEFFPMESAAVQGSDTALGSVVLSAPAPVGGITVTLSGSRTGLAVVPASVTVPEGEMAATFAITTSPTTTKRGVLVRATYAAQTRTTVLSVEPPPSSPVIAAPIVLNSIALPDGPMTSSGTMAVSSVEPILVDRHTLYTPELNLMMETAATNTATKPIAYEYVWFAGQPLAQIDTQTGAIHWYFNDHLGTPILQTDATASVVWRAEYEPYGKVLAFRVGASKHQPLRLPGQEEEEDLSYNIFRWYRSRWGRYTQADPLGVESDRNLYRYARNNPLGLTDPLGLKAEVCCRLIKSFVTGNLLKLRHCYISVDGVRFGLQRIDGFGKKTINFPDDAFGICKACEPKCGVGQMNCFSKFHDAYPDNVPYPLPFAAIGPNSNTYAANAAKTCCANGFPDGLGNTPGSDTPPPIPNWKDNFPEHY